jgi:hypothetical protein
MLIRKTIVTLLSLTVINAYADQIILSAVGHDVVNCRVDHRCDIKGAHDIQIINESSKPQTYKYRYTLCALKYTDRTDCNYAENTITVASNSQWNNHFDSASSPRFSVASQFHYIVETQVKGYGKAENQYFIKVNN